MTDFSSKLTRFWQDGVNVLLGLWLIVSPWALAFVANSTASWNVWIIGTIIAVASAAALVAFHAWEEWVNIALAAWLIISPWIFGFADLQAAMWNQIIVGLIVGGLAIWSASVEHDDVSLASKT